MADPLVTIGMPVYNEERFLSEALRSLLAQDFEDFEIVVVDNASRDATRRICSEFVARDTRIRYYRNPENLGAVVNFRRALELASGKYFMWAAGHDLWDPAYLSSCVAALEAEAQVVLAYSRIAVIDGMSNVVEVVPAGLDTRGEGPFSRVRSTIRALRKVSVNDMVYGLIRTACLRRTEFRTVWGCDEILALELSLQGCFAQVDRVLYFRREQSGRAEDMARWTDNYWARLDPKTASRRLRFTYSQFFWNYARIVFRLPFRLPERVRLLATVIVTLLRRHFAGIVFHDLLCGFVTVTLGKAAAVSFKRLVYGVIGRWRKEAKLPG